MPGIVIVGAQWGDEGKGKVVDLLAERADVVIRFQGGNNAGHTIVRDGRDVEVPPHPERDPLPGQDAASSATASSIDPRVLTEEIDGLRARGIDVSGLKVSANAHLIMPYHLMLDQAGEAKLGKLEIGTTKRGIGPVLRRQGRAPGHPRAGPARREDPQEEDRRRAGAEAPAACGPFAKRPAAGPADDDRGVPDLRPPPRAAHRRHGDAGVPTRSTTAAIVLFEGAQGALLDIDHGTYPFVTSSNPVAGRGVRRRGRRAEGHRRGLGHREGVHDARRRRARSRPSSTTRPASEIRERGGEFGTTTGRPRRTGWLDLVALRYAARLNAPDGARRSRSSTCSAASTASRCARATAAPRRRSSTTSPTTSRCSTTRGEYDGAARLERGHRRGAHRADLPHAARDYLRFIAEHIGVPVVLVGVGPGREQIVWTGEQPAAIAA